MSIYRVAYYSRNAMPEKSLLTGFRDIHAEARKFNKANGLTGYLLFDKACFVQILEGEEKTVRACYRKIAKDPRHSGLVIIGTDQVLNRTFDDWSMGAMLITPEKHEVLLSCGVTPPLDPTKLTMSKAVRLLTELKVSELRSAMPTWSWRPSRAA